MAETERLLTSSEIFIINATEMNVDVYVNFETQATISDPTPMAVTPAFVVEDTFERPYGVYTFSVRLKDDPTGPVLASASVDMQQGFSFSGAFHHAAGGGFQFSIYENDLSDGTDARLTVRNTSALNGVVWTLNNSGENPEVPRDSRDGVLDSGQWQISRSVQENDYLFEFFDANGGRLARNVDLNLGLEEHVIVYLIGTPEPTASNNELQRHIINQELEFDVGPAVADSTSSAAPPLSTTDMNQAVEFDCPVVEVWETNSASVTVTATDPDSVVGGLQVKRVDPDADGFVIEDSAFTPSSAIGQTASAEISIASDIADGQYQVTIEANPASLAQTATCALDVTIKQITIERLTDQVNDFDSTGDITDSFADKLRQDLSKSQAHLDDDEIARACKDLNKFLNRVESKSGSNKITEPAAVSLTREGEALAADLACG